MKNRWIRVKILSALLAAVVCVTQVQLPIYGATKAELQAAVEETKAALEAAQGQLAAATETADTAKAAAEQAQISIAKGSYGFFEANGYAKAMAVLEDQSEWVTTYTTIGEDADATSLANLKGTVAWLKKCNELRAQEGTDPMNGGALSPLKVSMELMAISELQSNWSARHIGHISSAGIADYHYSVGENLAWGYADPFTGWYTKEKALWDQAAADTAAYPKLASCKSAYELSQTYPKFYHTVGHYLNVVASNYATTGFGVNQYNDTYGVTHEQSFGLTARQYGETMTIDEFEQKLNEYCLPLESAAQAYRDALSAQETAQGKYDAAKEAYDAAVQALEEGAATPKPTYPPPGSGNNGEVTPTPTARPTETPAVTESPTPTTRPTETPAVTTSPTPTARPSETPAVTTGPAPTARPTETPAVTISPQPTTPSTGGGNEEATAPQFRPLQKGDTFEVASCMAVFRVIDADGKNPAVECVGLTAKGKKATKIKLPQTVNVKGAACRVTRIAANMCKGNKKIKQITIPASVTALGDGCFEGCSALTKVSVGQGVESIGKRAFKNCKSLKKISITSQRLKKVGKQAIAGTKNTCRIVVPGSKVKAYSALFKNKR